MTGQSSLQQLLLFMNNILVARTHSSNANVIYIDFRKLLIWYHTMNSYTDCGNMELQGIFGCGLGPTCPPEHNVLK